MSVVGHITAEEHRDAAASASHPARPWRRWLALPAVLAGFLALAAYRFATMTGAFRNSDDAANFLAGVEMAEGNWRLHGWLMAAENYYPTDVLAVAVLHALFGWHPIVMQGLEALIWAAIAVIGTGLACRGALPGHRAGIISLALALLAFNVFEHEFRDVTLSNIGSHGSTILVTLLAFWMAARIADADICTTRRAKIISLGSLGCLVTMGEMADQLFNVIACLPILAVSLLGLGPRETRRRCLAQIATILAAVLLARVVLTVNAHNGGFHVFPIGVALASFPHLLDHVGFAAESIPRLLGAEFFGGQFNGRVWDGPIIYLLRAPLVALFVVTGWQVGGRVLQRVRSWPANTCSHAGQDLDHLLWFSLFFGIASTCMTTAIIDDACVRFFLPAAVTGSILVARKWGTTPLAALYGAGVLLVSIVFGCLRVSPDSPRRVVAIPEIHRIVAVLRQHDLHHGYAGFWESMIVTVLSNRESTSLPVAQGADGRLHPVGYFDNADWFRTAARDWHGRVFFISWQPDQLDNFELAQATLYRQFGRPAERIDLGNCVISVYDLPPHALDGLASGDYSRSPVQTPPP